MTATALLEARDLRKLFPSGTGAFGGARRTVRAVDGVSLAIAAGETLGLVGESGSGKSTVGRMLVGLELPTDGSVRFEDREATGLRGAALKAFRRRVQMVFQDPYASLDPRMTAGAAVAEALAIHRLARGAALRERVAALFEQVGLRPDQMARYPHSLSGGQRQRLGIARALAVEPRLVVADEPVSALDVSVQAQIVNLLADLQRTAGLAYLFISHDIAVVAHLSHRVAVMYLGRIVEIGPTRAVVGSPRHPYTESLIAATPDPDPARRRRGTALAGEIPSAMAPPAGCAFHTRCPIATADCKVKVPVLRPGPEARWIACHNR
jgi:peptide/nickel transport system ATP-binding protein/oligopeptide transport system ATP-binding protein